LPNRSTLAGNFEYDANGRLKNDRSSGNAFTYSTSDQPVFLVQQGRVAAFVYDENNYRMGTIVSGHPN